MSESRGKADSDDEFQDALSDPTVPTATANEIIVEEIVRGQQNLKLNDAAANCEGIPSEADSEADGKPDDTEAELIDDEFDEEQMREAEKSMTEAELEENKEKANQLKLQGNELFKNEEADKAVAVYTEALHICPTTFPKDRAVLFGNRAAASIKLDARKSAIEDCTKAVALWPEYVRALVRRAKLFELEDKLDEALEDYKKVYELDPGQREAREAMVRLPPLIQERNEKMKEEMMSKLKDLGNMILKPFGLSTSNFQMQQDPNSGSYSINFNQGK